MSRLHPLFAADRPGADPASGPRLVGLAIRDHRCALHRAMLPYDLAARRDLRRTTISDPRRIAAGSSVSQLFAAVH